MAELSAETAAIVERLRAEGDLVRNSGANSIRSVKIKLDRFDGLFTSIQTNIAEQTQILRQQAGVQEAATEAAKRQEDFENLKAEREVVAQKDNRAAQEDRDAKLIDGMRNAFSLKNLALGAGGAFLGYNLLKGAIDDQFNNAFSNMERSLSNFNPAMIQETFNQLQTTVASMNDAVQTLNQTILGLEEDVEAFKNSLAIKALTLLASIPLGFALTRGLAKGLPAAVREYRSGQLDRNDRRGNQIRPGESGSERARRVAAEQAEAERVRAAEAERARAAEVERARRIETERFRRASRVSEMTLRANRITPVPSFTPDGANYLPDDMPTTSGRAFAANSNMPRINPPSNVVPFRTPPSSLTPPPSMNAAPVIRVSTPPANQNKPATRSELTKLLQDYNDRIPAKWRNAILKIFDFLSRANIAFKLIDLTIMLGIMGESSEEERHRLLGSFVGGIVGAGGGAFLGGLVGAFGGPFAWITAPAGAIAGGILGGYGGDWLGYKIVEWALGDSPPPGEIETVNAQILAEMATVSGAGAQMMMAEAAAKYGVAGETTTTGINYGMPAQPGLGASTNAIPGMGVGSGSVYPNAKLSSAQARRIVNIQPGFETNALDAIAATALMNGNVIVVKGGDQTVSPVITQQGGSVSVEAPTIIGNHMDRNMNTYASGPYPGVVYE
jgi:hypothetical protein